MGGKLGGVVIENFNLLPVAGGPCNGNKQGPGNVLGVSQPDLEGSRRAFQGKQPLSQTWRRRGNCVQCKDEHLETQELHLRREQHVQWP